MIITLSPAKMLDFKSDIHITDKSTPLYAKEAKELNTHLKDFSAEDIVRLMKISPKHAMDIHEYIQTFDAHQTPQRQAMFAYNGIAYLGLEPESFSAEDIDFAQQHLVIISGLYGAVRPLDMIKPYRLEMKTALSNNRGKNLYAYWSATLTKYLNNQLKKDDKTWVNLSSNEYSKAIDRKELLKGTRIITPIFKEHTGKEYKIVMAYAKKARGMMTRFIIQNKLQDTEHIKAFDTGGYSFANQLSNSEEWVFVR